VKIVLSWLNEFGPFANPADVDAVARVADDLTSLGLAVESVDQVDVPVDGVVAAVVRRLERHPDAAKVQRVWVDAGDGAERHVWCGADNMAVGDIVALATLGTRMPDGRSIERRGILGIDSEGMLCSAVELGLGDDHSGIMIGPVDATLGASWWNVLGRQRDVVFDLDLTRNRPDCWSHLGVARDLAAHRSQPMVMPMGAPVREGDPVHVPVDIEAGDRCGRFTATVIDNVVVGPSAPWMQARLAAAGMRSINNVVDVSNYVMLEMGQPNHAYDLDTLAGGGFRVRPARDGETLVTLDEVERSCTQDDLLICDAADVPVGLAGVMGGLDSEISASTTRVVVEAAWFTPGGVMATAARHGLRSEASARFERGVDPTAGRTSSKRFAELLAETCPDLVVHAGEADVTGTSMPGIGQSVEVRGAVIDRVLGRHVPRDQVLQILAPIGFEPTAQADTDVVVQVPPWRPDCTSEIDIVEEVARHIGYDNLGRRVPRPSTGGGLSTVQQRRRELRRLLIGAGVSEAMPNPFVDPGAMARVGLDGPVVSIVNPLVSEESVLRTSLRAGLLSAIAFNESHRRDGVALFEIGHIYPPAQAELPDEREVLCVLLAGRDAAAAVQLWDEIAAALGVGAMIDQRAATPGLHPGRSAALRAGRSEVGVIGEVDPRVLQRMDVSERVAIVEIDLTEVLAREPKPAAHRAVSRMPSSDLDLAFVVADSTPAADLAKALRSAAGPLAVSIELFDTFRGDSLGDGVRSLAFRLRLQAADRSLTDDDVSSVRAACVSAAESMGATLRG